MTYAAASDNWRDVTDSTGNTLTFTANGDRNTPVTNDMPERFAATDVRLWPVAWYGHVSMRFMVHGCKFAGKLQTDFDFCEDRWLVDYANT